MREAGGETIVIKDVQPDVFRALLHFIYTDSLPPLDDVCIVDYGEMIRHLLVVADRYAMGRLKLISQSTFVKVYMCRQWQPHWLWLINITVACFRMLALNL
jgi:ABC-type maltose transport system permease subunit